MLCYSTSLHLWVAVTVELVELIIRLATAIIIVAIITKLFIIIFTAFASF